MIFLQRSRRSPAIVVVPLVAIAAIAGSAVAGSSPNANSAGKADKALKKAKKAIKIAKAADKAEGRAGPAGQAGPPGSPGAQGAPGADSANVVMAQTTGLSTAGGTTQYIFPVGVSTPGAENDREAVLPSGDNILITDFRVSANAVLGAAGNGYRVSFREDNADLNPNLTCQVAGNITGCSVAQAAELAFPGNLSIEFETLNTPTANIEVAVSYRMQVAPAP